MANQDQLKPPCKGLFRRLVAQHFLGKARTGAAANQCESQQAALRHPPMAPDRAAFVPCKNAEGHQVKRKEEEQYQKHGYNKRLGLLWKAVCSTNSTLEQQHIAIAVFVAYPDPSQDRQRVGMTTLGIDFGTSNSAVGYVRNGMVQIIPMEPGETTLPTAVFFDFDTRQPVYGHPANAALIAGDEGRYMRALKSLLGTGLMRESRMILNERLDFITIIARFLQELKQRAEAATGEVFDTALSGRPVMFHSADPNRNAQALVDLTECYLAAGFREVAFMPEPEAAALASRAALASGDLGLVVDIGGGTSDFTVFRHGDKSGIEILASHGLRLGGTDFDRQLSMGQVMPLLGLGSQIKHAFGDQTHTAPQSIFGDLATWQKIPFLYARDTRNAAKDLAKYAVEPDKLARLVQVLKDELGHDLAFAVEAGKVAANDPAGTALPEIKLNMLERGLTLPLPAPMMWAALADMAGQIGGAAEEAVAQAGVTPDQITRLVFVGGSSLMTVVQHALTSRFEGAKVHRGAALTGIVEGLALASQTAFD